MGNEGGEKKMREYWGEGTFPHFPIPLIFLASLVLPFPDYAGHAGYPEGQKRPPPPHPSPFGIPVKTILRSKTLQESIANLMLQSNHTINKHCRKILLDSFEWLIPSCITKESWSYFIDCPQPW